MAEKLSAQGAQLLVGSAVVPGVTSIDGPGDATPTLDATAHDSDMQEFRLGLPSPGQVTGTLFLDPQSSVHQAMLDDYDARTIRGFAIKWPSSTPGSFQGSVQFSGYWAQIRPTADTNAMFTAAFTIQLTGAVTRFP